MTTGRLSNVKLKLRPQPLVRLWQRLGQQAGFADDGHKVRIGDPAGENVHVDVSGDTGARGLADVHPEVDAVGLVKLGQDVFEAAAQGHHLSGNGFGQGVEAIDVIVRDYHDMTRGIGISVQNDEIVPGAMDDEGFFVVPEGQQIAEYAAIGFVDGRDVSIAPRRPKIVHYWRE